MRYSSLLAFSSVSFIRDVIRVQYIFVLFTKQYVCFTWCLLVAAAESLKADAVEQPLKWVALKDALDEINEKRAERRAARCAHCGLPTRAPDARSNALVLVEDERVSKELRQASGARAARVQVYRYSDAIVV